MSDYQEIETRDIPGFPGYRITPDGQVFSSRSGTWKSRKSLTDAAGYLRVGFWIQDKQSSTALLVHQLVLLTFAGPKPSPEYETRHLDGNKLNNHISNLAWGTSQENANDRMRHGPHWTTLNPEKVRRGDNHWTRFHPDVIKKGDASWSRNHPERIARGSDAAQAILTEEDIPNIRKRIAAGEKHRIIAADYGVSRPTITALGAGRTWKHIPVIKETP